ncbi:hypothetical protein EUX48_06145 [Haemophilus haemolyticus]|uniref:Uncharacterized protein n=1 Tax=Haemophilus haemolyticus TaxID=726 RepID=A0A502LJW5_HAEHA|nr:hypothetical protein [Haemophilus haemolyticus]TPH22545.1 hypothetical protein EUX48_06145 [Haemophilus haemolyticus]
MKRKFSIMGLVSVVFWAISIGFFLIAVESLFVLAGSSQIIYFQAAQKDYLIFIILFFITNPKVWEFVKNKIFK